MTREMDRLAYRVSSAIVALSLAGCSIAQEVNGSQTANPSNPNTQEVNPIPLRPIEALIPTQENFKATNISPLKGEIASLSGDLNQSDLEHFKGKITDAIKISLYAADIAAIPETELNVFGQTLEDSYGNKQLVVGLLHLGVGGKVDPITIHTGSGDAVEVPFFFYTDSRGYLFAPPDYGSPAEIGRLLPVGSWQENGKQYFGFGYEKDSGTGKYEFQSTFPLIEVDPASERTTYSDPYTGKRISWSSQQTPTGSIVSNVKEVSFQPQFLPTSTPDVATATPEPTATKEIVRYQFTTNAKEFLNFYIPPEALLPEVSDKLPAFIEYLKTLDWPVYDTEKLKHVQLMAVPLQGIKHIMYDIRTSPNYKDMATRPFHRLAFGNTTYEGHDYFVSAVQYEVDNLDAREYPWIITVKNLDKKGVKYTPKQIEEVVSDYMEGMNFPVLTIGDTEVIERDTDPLVHQALQKNPSASKKISDFIKYGNDAVPDGLLFQILVARGSDWFK